MDNIDRLKVFCLVAEKSSFAQAALQLGLPRSNVTYIIKSLEKEYEILLFYRTTRKVSLTNEGHMFYEEAVKLIKQLGELNRFKNHKKSDAGKISIGISKRLASEILIPNLIEFYKLHPKVKILINGSDDFSHLIEQQLDCVVRVGQVLDEYLLIRPITQTEIWTLASSKYLNEFGVPKTFDDLENHFAVDYQVSRYHQEWSTLQFSEDEIKVPYRILVDNTEAYMQAGLAGLGIIQIPKFDAIQYVLNGDFRQLFIDTPCLKLPINVLLTDRKYRPKYFQDFIEWLSLLLKDKLIEI